MIQYPQGLEEITMAKQLKDFLPPLIQNNDTWQLKLLSNCDTIIGNLKNKVRLEKIQNDTLVLGVYDACWMQELYLLTPLLLTTINQNLDQPRIKHLRFKRSVAKKAQAKSAVKPQKVEPKIHLTPKQKAALEQIEDPQLARALHDFLIRCHKE